MPHANREFTFSVEAFDEKEKVGEGVHLRDVRERAMVERRLAQKP